MSVIKYDDLSEESKEMLAKTGKKGENYKAKKLVNDFKYVKNYKINFLILFSNKKHFLQTQDQIFDAHGKFTVLFEQGTRFTEDPYLDQV